MVEENESSSGVGTGQNTSGGERGQFSPLSWSALLLQGPIPSTLNPFPSSRIDYCLLRGPRAKQRQKKNDPGSRLLGRPIIEVAVGVELAASPVRARHDGVVSGCAGTAVEQLPMANDRVEQRYRGLASTQTTDDREQNVNSGRGERCEQPRPAAS